MRKMAGSGTNYFISEFPGEGGGGGGGLGYVDVGCRMAGLRLAYCFNSRGGSQQSFILVLFMDQNLGSQLRGASTDARGRSSLHIDSEMCTNKLANADPRKEEADIQKVVKFLFDGRPPPSHKIVAMVEMASHAAMAYLNGVPVELYRSADLRTPAGVVIVVVVHPTTGRALRRYLVASHASARPLRALMASFQHGRLVLIAGTAFEVDPSIRSWLSDLGVTIPWSPTMSRVAWAWVGVVGGSTLGQVGGVLPPGTRRKLHLELYLPRVPDTPWCAGAPRPASEDDTRWAARVELCSLYDGYGEWCSCPPTTGIEPWPGQESAPAFTVKGTTTPDLTDVVTLALATRPDALHRLLVSLAAAAGGKNVSIVVFTNEPSHELTKVCESHGVQLEATGRASDCLGLHVSRLYESALRATLILKPRASFIITLEDDMEVFPTFYRLATWIGRLCWSTGLGPRLVSRPSAPTPATPAPPSPRRASISCLRCERRRRRRSHHHHHHHPDLQLCSQGTVFMNGGVCVCVCVCVCV
ncbi:uncharacterized protein [Panulirus ornatus]|uniref:uncharacterized protein isoform X3 n=1 Tax=Panulirus ornatus TaxID=150431 RepID=UPI003A8A7232